MPLITKESKGRQSVRPRLTTTWTRILYGRGLDWLAAASEILPAQWEQSHGYSPERQILITLLADAVLRLRRKWPLYRDEIQHWISGEEPLAPMPFNWVCENLGIDVSYARCKMQCLIDSPPSNPDRQLVFHGEMRGLRHHQPSVGGRPPRSSRKPQVRDNPTARSGSNTTGIPKIDVPNDSILPPPTPGFPDKNSVDKEVD